jgi:hypothetical protein
MNLKNIQKIVFILVTMFLVASFSGCKDLFRDPLVDKETGEDITVLLMDRNFIDTKLVVHLQDITTGSAIDNEAVEIKFSGDDSSNLITFGGNKQTTYNSAAGLVEVGYNPNIEVSSQNQIELTVVATSQNYVSAPQFLTYATKGIKDVVIKMYKKTTLKSAMTEAFGEPYDIYFKGQLQSTDLQYLADISSSSTGTAWEYINLYSAKTSGQLLCENLKDKNLYADYGAYFYNPSGGTSLLPPNTPVKNTVLNQGGYAYSAVLRSGLSKCENGLTIHVERANNAGGSGVFDYRITFSDGKTKTGKISCSFPSNNLIEQVYYPSNSPAVKVELFGDAQYNFSPEVNLSSPCGTANFTAIPKNGLKTYKLITRYSCPESVVGMGLSVIGEFRKKGTTDSWTSFKFIEGVCELQLVADSDYDFRINIDGEYYYYNVPTNPDKVKAYLQDDSSPDFKFRNLSIISSETSVTITTDVQFSQAVCDLIQ